MEYKGLATVHHTREGWGNKKNMTKTKINIIYLLIIANLFIYEYAAYKWYNYLHGDAIVTEAAIASPAKAASRDVELSVEEYVMKEVEKVHLDKKEVSCIIRHESGWNQYAINKNNNGTYDLGLVQINDIHNVPREKAFDYKFAIKWMIDKRLHDGNWNAWNGYKKCK